MKKIKGILIGFLLLFAFTFAFEDSKIELSSKRKEPAKLTIGVHKLKTKELNLDFNAEKKIIFGYLPDTITDNHLIFVSETLDEMPSVATTNGRRSINNIKKYLTKDIKVAPKFTYQVLVGDKENGIEDGKRYLLMNCKTKLSGVYIYVVEKDTYHIKEVYKGKFNIPTTLEERETYGTIYLGKDRGVFLNGKTIKYNRTTNKIVLSTMEGQASSVTIFGEIEGGEYPKKYIPENIEDYYNQTLNKYPAIKILLNGNEVAEQYFKENNEIENFKNGIFDINGIRVNTLQPTIRGLAGTLKIFTTTESEDKYNEHIKILLNNWYEFGNTESKISIQYGTVDINRNDWKVLRESKFTLKIDAKQEGMGDTTEGGLILTKEHTLGTAGGTITFDGSNAYLNGVKDSFIKLSGDAPKKLKNLSSAGETSPQIRIYSTSNGEIEWYKGNIDKAGNFSTADITLKAKKIVNGILEEKEAGKIRIFANDSSEYFQIEIKDWKRFAGDVSENIKISYIATDGKNMEIAVKTDVLAFGVNAPDEKIPEETDGQLYIYDIGYIDQAQILLSDEEVKVVNGDEFNPQKQSMPIGAFPKQFPVNPNEVDWGTDESKWYLHIVDISNEKNNSTIKLNRDGSTSKSDSLEIVPKWTIGAQKYYFFIKLEAKSNENYYRMEVEAPAYNEKDENFDKTFRLIYYVGDSKFRNVKRIIKEDTLRIRHEKSDELSKTRKIEVKNPIVWYDYDSSSPISNIAHDRRVHLSSSTPITRNKNGGVFNKNTQLNGADWIEVENIPDYDYRVGRHKVSFFSEKGESTKYTNSNGGTNSSTFINFGANYSIDDKSYNFNNRNGSSIMFSYDGGNKYLNFGVAKYEFSNSPQTTEVTIFHTYPENSENPFRAESMKLQVTLPPFDGREYVSPNYDIKPNSDYVHYHKFDDSIGQGEIIINYGDVGFRDLDTRITTQSGGEGIELRVYENVDLISESGTYTIKGAKLFFETGEREQADLKSDRTYFKGENEKSTFKSLKLWIPNQENLISKSRFKIVKTDTQDSPLEVGVSVQGREEFYKSVANLYLDLVDKRYVQTEITFENPSISTINSGTGEDWIYLNKSNYSAGKLVGRDDTTIWGSVAGDIIDIPVEHEALKDKELY